jgi:hypothetical protein
MPTDSEIQAALDANNAVPPNIIRPDTAQAGSPHFLRSDLSNQEFFRANRTAILTAARYGRIIDDMAPAPRQAITQEQIAGARAAAEKTLKTKGMPR